MWQCRALDFCDVKIFACRVVKQVEFTLEKLSPDVDASQIVVEVVGPSSKPPVKVAWSGKTGHGTFKPEEPGQHRVRTFT